MSFGEMSEAQTAMAACGYAMLILHDEGLDINAAKM